MPNGINYELDYEKHIANMADRQLLEFVARQALEQSQEITKIANSVKANKIRSQVNRYLLIVLIATLIALGIIDPAIFHIL